MKNIFISYSSKDKDFSDQLAIDLKEHGFQVWIDGEAIRPGEKWATTIQHGLNQADTMVVVISPSSMESKNVEDEWQFYLERKKLIIPILLEPTDNIHYQLNPIQRITFYQRDYDLAFNELCSELRRQDKQSDPISSKNLIDSTNSSFSLPLLEWCDVDRGNAKIITSNGNSQIYSIESFRISKFPVTNAQFQEFINIRHGYSNKTRWWEYSPHSLEWHSARPEPAKSPFAGTDLPRVNVNWYEAMAFCNWLSYKMDLPITLPSEQQWQRAAQGNDFREYPWGDTFDATKCNTKESNIQGATAVDHYPNGTSPYGVYDLSGNVWEWCRTNHVNGSNGDLDSKDRRVLRGGPWDGDQNNARLSSRNHADPDHLGQNIGFRLVTTSRK